MTNELLTKNIENFNQLYNIKNLEIDITKKFNPLEKKFIFTLIETLKANKKPSFTININKFDTNPSIFLENFSKKHIKYCCENKFSEKIEGSFPLISSYQIYGDNVIILISFEFFESFKPNNFFKYLSLSEIILFKEKHTLTIFLLLLKNYSSNELYFSIEELKSLFNIDDEKYPRYYDLEKNIILKIIADINKHSHLIISHEKIKKNISKNSKIIGLKFKFKNTLQEHSNEFINKLLSEGKEYIENFIEFQNICSEYINIYGENIVLEKFNYSLNNFDDNFICFFKNSFKKNIKDKIIIKPEIILEKKYSSLFFLYSDIMKTLNNIYKNNTLEFNIIDYTFAIDILKLKDRNKITFLVANHTINIHYFKKAQSTITFFKN